MRTLEYKKRSRSEDLASSSDFLTSYHIFERRRDRAPRCSLAAEIELDYFIGHLADSFINRLFCGVGDLLRAALNHTPGQSVQQIAAMVQIRPETLPFIQRYGSLFFSPHIVFKSTWSGTALGVNDVSVLVFAVGLVVPLKVLENLNHFVEHTVFLLYKLFLNVYFQVLIAEIYWPRPS